MHRWSLTRRLAGPAAVLAGLIPAALTVPAAAASPAGPPPVTVLTHEPGTGTGDIFISPFGDTASYPNGPEILSPSGQVIWFHPVPAGQEAGRLPRPDVPGPAGTDLVAGHRPGWPVQRHRLHLQRPLPADRHGQRGQRLLSADGHEFLITPWNTALILAYTTATANLTSIGGPADQTVIDGIVQEIDIRTGRVLFQWNSADHVPYSQSEQPLPASASTPWDWFHINAVHLASDGNLLIDARDTWTTYKVSLRTGKIIWRLGGKDSSFAVRAAPGQVLDSAGEIFAWQHDPEQVGPRHLHLVRQRVVGHAAAALQPGGDRPAELPGQDRHAGRLGRPARGPVGGVPGQRADHRATVICSWAGARCRTSPSSARPGSCCSTPSSRPG